MPMTGRVARWLGRSPIAIALAIGLSACGGGGGTTTVTVTVTVPRPTTQARVYLLRDGKVAPVSRFVSAPSRAALLQALAAGPTAQERRAGLTSAFPSGPDSRARLAQLVYTLTQQAPAGAVSSGGSRYTRADFEDETPAIRVVSPLPFQAVRSPLHASGTANTFEATFEYELRDAAGEVLATHVVTATSGSGIRGTFAFTARFAVAKAEPGTLVVYERSAKDGSRIHVVDIPLRLLA